MTDTTSYVDQVFFEYKLLIYYNLINLIVLFKQTKLLLTILYISNTLIF